MGMDIVNITAQDVRLFSSVHDAYAAHAALAVLCLSELVIWVYTSFGQRQRHRDPTLWLVIGAWCWGLTSGVWFRSDTMPTWIRHALYPHAFFVLGLMLLVSGVMLRGAAVVTLRHAFTHAVQTRSDQRLIQNGLYRWVRNPAYTGSIISLMGATLVYRSIVATLSVLIVCTVCYGVRIQVEERALHSQFHDEWTRYCHKVKYRLFPGLY